MSTYLIGLYVYAWVCGALTMYGILESKKVYARIKSKGNDNESR